MKNSISQILLFTYPDLFQADGNDATIDIQPGWLVLINNLCWNLRACLALHPESAGFHVIRIAKEKGELSIHCKGGNPIILGLIEKTRQQARKTCEFDGKTAVGLFVCAPNWFRYLCNSCAELHGCASYSDFNDNFEPYENVFSS